MVELADTQDLGSCLARGAGSSPVIRRTYKTRTGLSLWKTGSDFLLRGQKANSNCNL